MLQNALKNGTSRRECLTQSCFVPNNITVGGGGEVTPCSSLASATDQQWRGGHGWASSPQRCSMLQETKGCVSMCVFTFFPPPQLLARIWLLPTPTCCSQSFSLRLQALCTLCGDGTQTSRDAEVKRLGCSRPCTKVGTGNVLGDEGL